MSEASAGPDGGAMRPGNAAALGSGGGATMGPERVQALVDGVFAVAMTLLVLDVQAPASKILLQHDGYERPLRLTDLPWANILLYAISFVIVGIYWVGHHNQFAFIKRTDRQFLWINILFLLSVAFIPFSTSLLGRFIGQQVAVVVYGVNLIATGLILYLHWWYAVSGDRLTAPGAVDAHLMRLVRRRILTAPCAYLLAIVFSFVPAVSIAIYVLVPLTYLMPGHLDRHMLGLVERGRGDEHKTGRHAH